MSGSTCVIAANPDVTGIGIRASIYALVLGGRILVYLIAQMGGEEGEEEARDFRAAVESALTLQGLALLCTAIYQTSRQQLSLFHAICCVHLLALLGVSITPVNSYGSHGPWRTYGNAAFSLLAILAFVGFDSYVWATAPTFGSQPDCNADTRYVIFGVAIRATNDVFRYIILASFAATAAGFIITITCLACCFVGFWVMRDRLGPLTTYRSDAPVSEEPAALNSRAARALANVVLMTGVSIYAIVSLEQTIAVNNVGEEEREWGFGQVLALFLLLGVVNELVNLGLAKLDKRNERRKDADPDLSI
ncbi:hypothetical protein HK405_005923 [Cladochytrium tenue]|nr:hypothetical protein HK405_005923 [Cladochytrium tenue]